MKKYINYLLLILIIGIYSCDKEEILLYGNDNFVFFKEDTTKEIIYSFSIHPDKTEDLIPLEIKLIGNLSSEDREFSVVVDQDKSNIEKENYELPERFILGANKNLDTIYIKVKKTDKLKTNKMKLVLNILSNKNFIQGPTSNLQSEIIIHDMISKPGWWDKSIVDNFLGEYSDLKFRIFIEVTKINDLEGKDEAFKRAMALKFKYFLLEQKDLGNIIKESDGKPMCETVTIVG